jgi:hypothetical protein
MLGDYKEYSFESPLLEMNATTQGEKLPLTFVTVASRRFKLGHCYFQLGHQEPKQASAKSPR